jgi:hypothetical protein
MLFTRTILYANTPTYSGMTYTLACILSLEKELNIIPDDKKVGCILAPFNNHFCEDFRYDSHRITMVRVEANELIVECETLETEGGNYLETHMKEFVFRPQASYYETDNHYVFLRHFFSINAIHSEDDSFNSFQVLWKEYATSHMKQI